MAPLLTRGRVSAALLASLALTLLVALLVTLLVTLGLSFAAAGAGQPAPLAERLKEHPALRALPPRLAWAWERPEDLRWLPADAGVAWLHSRILLQGEQALVMPRAQPMQVRPETVLVPVVHVDASVRQPPALTAPQRQRIVAQLLRAAAQAPSRVVQLDFEVRLSQSAFLADVVRAARQALPADVALSITALASWCASDTWLQGLPADEIVPMAFRMSRDSAVLRSRLQAQDGRFTAEGCGRAIGSATDEPLAGLRAPRHYVFSPRPWTPAAWAAHPFDTAPVAAD
jgi:hypothetical protein